jgi:ankyrin repeat protein
VRGERLPHASLPQVNVAAERGLSPLHFTAQLPEFLAALGAGQPHHCVRVAELLLAHGARVDAVGTHGTTPLFYAAQYGLRDLCEVLLDGGANVEHEVPAGADCVGVKCVEGRLVGPTVRGMMPGMDGTRPLMMACTLGHVAVVELLLDRGAQLNAARADGLTALGAAASGKHSELVKLLLARGAKLGPSYRTGPVGAFVEAMAAEVAQQARQ